MTVYEKIKSMSFDEMAELIYMLYNKGWHDGVKGEDDESVFGAYLLNQPASYLDEIE